MTRRVPFAIALIGIGLFLALRPFTSLAVLLGLTALVLVASGYALIAPRGAASPRVRDARARNRRGPALLDRTRQWVPPWLANSRPAQVALGFASAIAGISVVAWPRVTYTVFSYLPPALLLACGLYLLISLRTRTGHAGGLRARSLIFGPAAILLAFSGWRFPDVVLMLLAASLGITLVATGVYLLHARSGKKRPGWRRIGIAAVLPLAVGTLVLSGYLGSHPAPGEFYHPPEGADPAAAPGTLLRAQPHPAPAGARATRILYTTTRDESGTPGLASGVIYTPEGVSGAPVIAWAHGTTGQAGGCAPTLTGVETGAMLVLEDLLAAGWAVVATDYTGLGTTGPHPYLIGQGEARSVIDAVRAAAHTDLRLSEQTVLWGHSQGGHAALWAGGIWREYAPELPLHGVAAFAPAANLPAIFDSWGESKLTNIFASYVLAAYSAEYDDVDPRDYVRPAAQATVAAYASRCLDDPGTALTLTASLLQETTIWSDPDIHGPLRARAEENIPTAPIHAPVFIAQGDADAAIPPHAQGEYVEDRCTAGWPLDYRTYDGLDHMPLVEPESAAINEAILWTATLFSGRDVPESTC